jgi:CheY-like chemotaxis protein
MEKKTILVVEDDLEVCTLYKFLLEREGYVIREAHTGREALIQLGLEAPMENDGAPVLPIVPGLIVLDIMLPEIDGYTILSRLLQNDALKTVPVVVITAKSRMSDLFTSSSNVRGFFSKPFNPKAVREKIKEIIGP